MRPSSFTLLSLGMKYKYKKPNTYLYVTDLRQDDAYLEQEQSDRISSECETLRSLHIVTADSLNTEPCVSNETGTADNTNTSAIKTAPSAKAQRITRHSISVGDQCLTPNVEPDCAPFHGNQGPLRSNIDMLDQDVLPSHPYKSFSNMHPDTSQTEQVLLENETDILTVDINQTMAEGSRNNADDRKTENNIATSSVNNINDANAVPSDICITTEHATDIIHDTVLYGVNEIQAQTTSSIKTVNTNKEIAVMDIHREKEHALNEFRNEVAMETSVVLKEIDLKKKHALTEIATLVDRGVNKRDTQSTFESRHCVRATTSNAATLAPIDSETDKVSSQLQHIELNVEDGPKNEIAYTSSTNTIAAPGAHTLLSPSATSNTTISAASMPNNTTPSALSAERSMEHNVESDAVPSIETVKYNCGNQEQDDRRDVLILHSDEDRNLANDIMEIIVNGCALSISIDVYVNFATGKSKMNCIDDIFTKYRWVLFLVTPEYALHGFHNFQGGAVLMKELEENGNTHGRFVPLLSGVKRTDIDRAWLKVLQHICFPDDKFIESIDKLVNRFRKARLP